MANRQYNLIIDIKREIYEQIRIKPVDTGNVLVIRLCSDGVPLNLKGQEIKFMAKKPDGKGVYNLVEILENETGLVKVEITNQCTAIPGQLECEIEIEKDKLITTLTFYITVEPKLNDGTFIESTNEFTVLQKTIRDAKETMAEMVVKTDQQIEKMKEDTHTAIHLMSDKFEAKAKEVQEQTNSFVKKAAGEVSEEIAEMHKKFDTLDTNLSKKNSQELQDMKSEIHNTIGVLKKENTHNLEELTEKVDLKVDEASCAADNANGAAQKAERAAAGIDTSIREATQKVDRAIATAKEEVSGAVKTIAGQIKKHNHDERYYTKEETDRRLRSSEETQQSNFAPIGHNHDSQYLLKDEEVDAASLNGYTPDQFVHTQGDSTISGGALHILNVPSNNNKVLDFGGNFGIWADNSPMETKTLWITAPDEGVICLGSRAWREHLKGVRIRGELSAESGLKPAFTFEQTGILNKAVDIKHNLGRRPFVEVSTTLGNVQPTWCHMDDNTIRVYNYSNSGNACSFSVRCF